MPSKKKTISDEKRLAEASDLIRGIPEGYDELSEIARASFDLGRAYERLILGVLGDSPKDKMKRASLMSAPSGDTLPKCPKCRGSFQFMNPENGICPWCGSKV